MKLHTYVNLIFYSIPTKTQASLPCFLALTPLFPATSATLQTHSGSHIPTLLQPPFPKTAAVERYIFKIKVEISKISRSTPASPSSRNLLTYFCQWVFVLVWIRWLSRENLFSQKRERARKFLFFLHLKNISVNTQRGFPFTRTKALSGNTKKSFSSIHEKVFYQQM